MQDFCVYLEYKVLMEEMTHNKSKDLLKVHGLNIKKSGKHMQSMFNFVTS